MLQFNAVSFSLLALAASAMATDVSVIYDTTYDASNGSLANTACSAFLNGKGFKTFGDLPSFPNIGGTVGIQGNGGKQCGTCWQLESEGRIINVLAVDSDPVDLGWSITQFAMDTLTDGLSTKVGRIVIDEKQVDASLCGL